MSLPSVSSANSASPPVSTAAGGDPVRLRHESVAAKQVVKEGSFSIIDWGRYPAGVSKPTGSVNLINGAEYDASRAAANAENRAIHNADSSLAGQHIHEVQPVKFGGSPTDPANKVALDPATHYQLNTWWKDLQRYIENINK